MFLYSMKAADEINYDNQLVLLTRKESNQKMIIQSTSVQEIITRQWQLRISSLLCEQDWKLEPRPLVLLWYFIELTDTHTQ